MKSKRLPLSVIILTYNEEASIADCLLSVCGWAGEVFVVDSGSTDRTVEIVRQYTANIAEHPFENYAQQRNWAQEHLPLSFEWLFHIDADERVTPELVGELDHFFTSGMSNRVDAVLVRRRGIFLGRPMLHGGIYPVYHLRVFHHDKGRCEDRLYDQHFITDGRTHKLDGDLLCIVTTDLSDWMRRHVRWAILEAQEQLASQSHREPNQVRARLHGTPIEQRRWLRNDVYGRAPLFFRAFGYFFYRYFLRLGFIDGYEGLIFHFLQGFWYRFYVDAHIYEMRKAQYLPGRQSTDSAGPLPLSEH